MPTTQPDQAQTQLGVPVTIAVLANDTGAGLAIAGYTQPVAGSLVLNPDQSFTYTPVTGFSGVDGFSYILRDAAGATVNGLVTVAVMPPNAAPMAADDAAHAVAGGSVAVPVLANDNDPDDDPLTIVAIESPGHGTVQVEAGGQLRYTPQQGFIGTDSFTYTVSDGRGGAAKASVTINVATPNAAPVAAPDRVSTAVDTPVVIDAVANDDDPDGDALRLAGMTLPAHGVLTLTPEQRFHYTPAAGFVGSDAFTYTVKDGRGLEATGTVTVEVERRNRPPVAFADSAVSEGGEPVTLDLLANDDDPDGDPLALAALTLPAEGRLTVNPDRTVTYTPAPGFAGADMFTYAVSDGAATTEAEVTVTVNAAAGVTFANGYRHRRRLAQ